MNEERLTGPAGGRVDGQLSAGRQRAEGCHTCTVNVQKLLLIVNHSCLNVCDFVYTLRSFRTISHRVSLSLNLEFDHPSLSAPIVSFGCAFGLA